MNKEQRKLAYESLRLFTVEVVGFHQSLLQYQTVISEAALECSKHNLYDSQSWLLSIEKTLVELKEVAPTLLEFVSKYNNNIKSELKTRS